MPLKFAQAKDKTAVFNEIRKEYPGAGTGPGHNWQISNFNFGAPSDAWLRGLMPLATLKVELKGKSIGFDVYLVGESTNGPVRANVGTIKDG
jgi:hypothetical protein